MKVIITEAQEKLLAEQFMRGVKNKLGKGKINQIGKKLGTVAGNDQSDTGLSPEIAAKFDDINIEADAPNLSKFLKGMKNPEDMIAKLEGGNPVTKGSLTAPGAKKSLTALIPKGKEMMHPLGHKTKISSKFGRRNGSIGTKDHKGIDLATPSGSSVYSPLDGVVTKSLDTTPNACGGHIRINHGKLQTKYFHLSKMIVHKGQKVKKGTLIGYSGGAKTDPHPGTSTGAHLHYEILNANNVALNPIEIETNLV